MSESGGIDLGTIQIGAATYPLKPGDTILDVARRNGVEIPTLCHDPRLDPAGACRTCLVEVEGWRRMPPACATRAAAGMRVISESPRIERHRRSLLSLYMTDHPKDRELSETGAADGLLDMVQSFGTHGDWGSLPHLRADRPADQNPYINFNPDTCIVCARCTRYCDEVEGVSAITLAGRGAETTIATPDLLSLMETSCELCGGCIAVCPTGAMGEKLPLVRGAKPERELEKVRSTCNFCGVGCQLDLNVDRDPDGPDRVVKVTSPEPGTTTNDGNLCVKGRFAYDFIHHEERLTTPLIRGADGELHPASWEQALQAAAEGLRAVEARHGADGLAFISSSRCTMEENYLVQKLSRVVFGTNNVHQCAAT